MSTEPPNWRPSLGAWLDDHGTRFRVWATGVEHVDAVVEPPDGSGLWTVPLVRAGDGAFSAITDRAPVGSRYRYRLDGHQLLPDPASRFQPEGVHGPSEVVDASFAWTDSAWRGRTLDDAVFYEVHVGAFTGKGTFAAAAQRLEELADLGVTMIELMPVADFPGRWNWGYDGVSLFAPARCYGRPEDLRRLVDEAHRIGLGVALDVVYNHFGPDGAYLGAFSPRYFTHRYQTPWGAAINFDGEDSRHVRAFFIENALHWVHEYHIDALRLDATHAIFDESPRHIAAEIAARVHATTDGRALVVAEDHRNLAAMLHPEAAGGWGLDGLWSDDFHHTCRRFLAGDSDGYYRDFSGRLSDIATTIRRGWLFTGQYSSYLGEARGTDPEGLDARQFVFALQNHDQIGNRALGERLHHQIDPAAFRAATVVLVTVPETPLLFMGQDWAASTPFLYFTDHHEALGRLVTEGRRREFAGFREFSSAEARTRIPDPQAPSTFERSRLSWQERTREPHAAVRRLTKALLALRRREADLRRTARSTFDATTLDEETLAVTRGRLLVVARLRGSGEVDVSALLGEASLEHILSSEDDDFAADPAPIRVQTVGRRRLLSFLRPSAVVLRRG